MRKDIKAYIEAELRDYHATKKDMDEVRTDIIEATPLVPERGSNLPGDQTAAKTINLITCRELRQMERVVTAIENVLLTLDSIDLRLVHLKYWQKPRQLTDAGIALKIGMGKATVWRRANDICFQIARELGMVSEIRAKMKKK